jgi:hypothetical protein
LTQSGHSHDCPLPECPRRLLPLRV